MHETVELGELYRDFEVIDTDAPGGYARVAKVSAASEAGRPERAFKVMRRILPDEERTLLWDDGFPRFLDELGLLVQIFLQPDAPEAITRIHDSGYAPADLTDALDDFAAPDPRLSVYRTGKDVAAFEQLGRDLQRREPERWRPFLVVELAGYDDSLFRQINRRSGGDEGLYRLPTGEVIYLAGQVLDLLTWLHASPIRRAYIDWKPEHVHWNGSLRKLKLIDWNVTEPLDSGAGQEQNIRDDVRLFCGGALYSALTMVDLDGQLLKAKPTSHYAEPIPQAHRRYMLSDPLSFYQARHHLDHKIQAILRRGLTPSGGYATPKELKQELYNYAESELGLKFPFPETGPRADPAGQAYWRAAAEVREAQQRLFDAYRHLTEAIEYKGATPEYERLRRTISRTLGNFPLP